MDLIQKLGYRIVGSLQGHTEIMKSIKPQKGWESEKNVAG